MPTNKHTPSPWTAREVRSPNVPGQIAYAIDFNEDQEQVVDWVYEKSDAHLIAAAPDLLADLREAASTLRRYEAIHRSKGTDDSAEKAEVNAALAARFEATIDKAGGAS
ncbi:hypothetical protein JTA33_00375 [Pseudomonas sp. 20GA0080]|nr:hypothetical protein [Pseudomonas alliivorans]